MLPKIDMGDVLVIMIQGAHGFSMGYNYNGKLKIRRGALKRRWKHTAYPEELETPADYFAT